MTTTLRQNISKKRAYDYGSLTGKFVSASKRGSVRLGLFGNKFKIDQFVDG